MSVLQPKDNVTKLTNECVQLIAYNNAKFFMAENQTQLDYLDKQKVIFVKIKGRQLKNLATPVSYTMSNVEVSTFFTVQICSFWCLYLYKNLLFGICLLRVLSTKFSYSRGEINGKILQCIIFGNIC